MKMRPQQVVGRLLMAASMVIVVGVLTASGASTHQKMSQFQPQQQASSTKQTPDSISSTTSTTTVAPLRIVAQQSVTSAAPRSGMAGLVTAASLSSGAGSLIDRKSLAASSSSPASGPLSSQGDFDTFDGKNPFADDSLWQIPIHLVRELSASSEATPTSGSSSAPSSKANSASAQLDQEDLDNERDERDDLEPSVPTSGVQLRQQSSSSSPTVISASTDLKTAAGYHYPSHGYAHHDDHQHHAYKPDHHHHYGHGKYFQYASVPYPDSWEAGYRRGNPYHTIERHDHAKGPHFKTKVKWSDKHAGYGVHVWDYNHDDHYSHHKYHDDHYAKLHTPAHHYDHH